MSVVPVVARHAAILRRISSCVATRLGPVGMLPEHERRNGGTSGAEKEVPLSLPYELSPRVERIPTPGAARLTHEP